MFPPRFNNFPDLRDGAILFVSKFKEPSGLLPLVIGVQNSISGKHFLQKGCSNIQYNVKTYRKQSREEILVGQLGTSNNK
jgi:hypothetical protein